VLRQLRATQLSAVSVNLEHRLCETTAGDGDTNEEEVSALIHEGYLNLSKVSGAIANMENFASLFGRSRFADKALAMNAIHVACHF
jgi:hypothetical protein